MNWLVLLTRLGIPGSILADDMGLVRTAVWFVAVVLDQASLSEHALRVLPCPVGLIAVSLIVCCIVETAGEDRTGHLLPRRTEGRGTGPRASPHCCASIVAGELVSTYLLNLCCTVIISSMRKFAVHVLRPHCSHADDAMMGAGKGNFSFGRRL